MDEKNRDLTNPKAIAERGEEIYRRKYQEEYETRFPGKFVAIDVITETASVGDTPEDVFETATKKSPQGVFHLIQVGSSGAFRVGSASNANLDWIFR